MNNNEEVRKEIDKLEGDNIEVVDKHSSLKQLDDEMGKFNDMPKKWRRVSDWKSLELFGMTNQEHYEKMRSKLLAQDNYNIEDIPLSEAYDIEEPKLYSIMKYDENAIQSALDWSVDSMRLIITPQKTEQELDDLFHRWNEMPLKQRRESDWKSLELFYMNNKNHYEILKSRFLRRDFDTTPEETLDPDISLAKLNIFESDSYIEKLCKYTQYTKNINDKMLCCLELSSIKEVNYYEESLIRNTIKDAIDTNNDSIDSIGKDILFDDLPFFQPTDMEDMGVHSSEPYYASQPDNLYLDDDHTISTKTWYENYRKLIQGALTEDMKKLTILWVKKLNELYLTYDKIKESGDTDKINARKQSILELGWNPEIDFSIYTRKIVSKRMKDFIKESYKNTQIIDLSKINIDESMIEEYTSNIEDNSLYPIFIVLVYTGTGFGKLIVKFTNGVYSHSAIGFEPDLRKLYSFNQNQVYNAGFAIESIDDYKKGKDSIMSVYAVFVKKKDILKIKSRLDYFLANKNKTHYSIANLFGILTNKVINIDLTMVCSQFVDSLLKVADIDITGKTSALVVPNDFTKTLNKKVYKIYEGSCKDYDVKKVNAILSKLRNKYEYIKESILKDISSDGILTETQNKIFNFIEPYIRAIVTEAKEFPVQFDKDGNLLIKRMKSLDFESEYAQIHKLLLVYEEKNNIDGMKYELSKLWFMNTILEKKIFTKGKSTDDQLDSYHKARAKILNNFNKYLKVVLKGDPEFNFTEYYNESPFSDASTKINASTLKYSGEIIKSLLKF